MSMRPQYLLTDAGREQLRSGKVYPDRTRVPRLTFEITKAGQMALAEIRAAEAAQAGAP